MNINVSRVTLKMTSYNYIVPTVATKALPRQQWERRRRVAGFIARV